MHCILLGRKYVQRHQLFRLFRHQLCDCGLAPESQCTTVRVVLAVICSESLRLPIPATAQHHPDCLFPFHHSGYHCRHHDVIK